MAEVASGLDGCVSKWAEAESVLGDSALVLCSADPVPC